MLNEGSKTASARPSTDVDALMSVQSEKDIERNRFREWFESALKTKTRTTLAILPWQAEIMMETNTGNRTLSLVRAARYAKEMKAKAWEVTGEPLIFSDEGILNDGQTRLKACVIAGVPFTTHITFGVARKAFRVTGVGAKRTLADVLSIAGEANTTNLAGALNWLKKYKTSFSAAPLTHLEGLQLLADNPDIRQSTVIGRGLASKTHLIDPSLAIFLHYVFALKDTDKADAFLEYLGKGIGVNDENDPRHKLRERLITNKGEKAKLPNIEIAALAIKAWNAHYSGNHPRYLRWQTSEAAGAEPFPRVQ